MPKGRGLRGGFGHSGKGAFCHRCRAEELSKNNPTPVTHLPLAHSLPPSLHHCLPQIARLPFPALRHRAVRVLRSVLLEGNAYTRFGGKRMHYNRRIISIPLGLSWRLLLEERHDKSKSLHSILSHEQYNRIHPN